MTQDELFQRDGFTMNIRMKHPDSDAQMEFSQWEAKYVSELQALVDRLEKYVRQLERTIALQAELQTSQLSLFRKTLESKAEN